MTSKTETNDPSVINSSFTIFYLVATVVWANILSRYFPPDFRARVTILMILFAVMLILFNFLIRQLYDGVTVLSMVLLYAALMSLMTFMSAVKGPIADGKIPIIYFLFLSTGIYDGAGPSLLLASVFTFYGLVTTVCSLLSAICLEFIYQRSTRFIPKFIREWLIRIDSKTDTTSGVKSFKLFAVSDWKGIAVIVGLLLTYTITYTIFLII